MRSFIRFFFSPGIIAALILCETIYWTSPEWAQQIHFPTQEDSHRQTIVSCTELLQAECKAEIVHDGGAPIPPETLPEWRLIRVEKRFDSGFAVVSSLNPGPHGTFQYVVRDLDLPESTVFRILASRIWPT